MKKMKQTLLCFGAQAILPDMRREGAVVTPASSQSEGAPINDDTQQVFLCYVKVLLLHMYHRWSWAINLEGIWMPEVRVES